MAASDVDDISSYYDAVPYDSHPFPQTAPEHLEALAFLFGLDAAAPATARVLELGCAAGGNLIPFAARHPKASALGVDLSGVQVAQGVALIADAGLSNVELRTYDITQIDASFGKFDYIICHGVYSWVPEVVQQAILRVCSENLALNGVAYLSYNIYPGWKSREIVRDAMILRGGPRDAPSEKLAYARGMLEFLEKSARADSVLKKTLEETMPTIRDAGAYYLLHEFLEPFNAPCYFKEFAARAAAEGLSYLADAEPSTMFVQNYGHEVIAPLIAECGGDQLLMEQYLDFLVNRAFRQSLFVHQARAPKIRYRLERDRLRGLEFSGTFKSSDGSPFTMDAREHVVDGYRGQKVTLRHGAQKAAVQVLDKHYPASMSVKVLLDEVALISNQSRELLESVVLAFLEELLIAGCVRARRTSVDAAVEVTEKPLALAATRGAKALALSSGASANATNQWHESIALSPVERCLMPVLDGQHDHEALTVFLTAEANADRIRFFKDSQQVVGDAALVDFARQQVTVALTDLRRKGLLVG